MATKLASKSKLPAQKKSTAKYMPENTPNVMRRKVAMDKIVARRRRAMKKEMC